MATVKNFIRLSLEYIHNNYFKAILYCFVLIVTGLFAAFINKGFSDANALMSIVGLIVILIFTLMNIFIYKANFYESFGLLKRNISFKFYVNILWTNVRVFSIFGLLALVFSLISFVTVYFISLIVDPNQVFTRLVTTFIPFIIVIALVILVYKLFYLQESIIINGKMKLKEYFTDSRGIITKTNKTTLFILITFLIFTTLTTSISKAFVNNLILVILLQIFFAVFSLLLTTVTSVIYKDVKEGATDKNE